MLILNCTKAAADFFSTTKEGKKISALQPAPKQTIADSIAESNDAHQWQWLVHVIKVNRKSVLVAMDYETRFSITLSELKKGDGYAFLNDFEHHLNVHVIEMMTGINTGEQAINASLERYRDQHDSCAFYLRGDRSVQSHINDVTSIFRRWVDELGDVPTGVDLIGHDDFVNELLRKRKAEKDYFHPQLEFLRGWLRHCGACNTAQADAYIDALVAKEHADFAARHPGLIPKSQQADTSSPSNVDSGLAGNVIAFDAYRKN